MRVIVVLGSYYPNYSAVGFCAKKIVDIFVKKGYDVWVLCNKTSVLDCSITIDGARVRYYSTSFIEKRLVLNGWHLTLLRACYFIKVLCSHYSVDKEVLYAIEDGLNEIVVNEMEGRVPDTIVPIVFPFESVLGSINWVMSSGSSSRIIPVVFDNFVDNPNLHRLHINRVVKYKRHLQLFRESIGKCDRVLVMHNQKNFFLNNNFNNNYFFVEHPLLVKPVISNNANNNHDGVRMLYSGALLKKYVVGKDLCELVSKVVDLEPSIKAEFCVMGNDTKCVDKLAKRYPNNIINNGKVPMQVALTKIAEADILLCVAEKKGMQISSKIFTYMSYGKPIVLLYYRDDDINTAILSKYPLFFPVKASEVYQSIPGLIRFVTDKGKKRLSFENVMSLYPEALPETLCDLIIA